jgi:DNA-binding response OmpR family regulator
MRILVVDDDPKLNKLVCEELEYAGYRPDPAYTAREAIEKIGMEDYALAVVDWIFDGEEIDGTDVIRAIYSKNRIPILMLTGKGALADRVAGLEAGADDYLVKPFYLPELLARVSALLRRSERMTTKSLKVGPLSVDLYNYEISVNKNRLNLRKKEFKIFYALIEADGKIISRLALGEAIWGKEGVLISNSIDVHIKSLRDKLKKYSKCIETVRGIGYRFNKNF